MHPSVKPPSHVVDPIGMNVRGLFVSAPDRYPHRLIDCRPSSSVVSDGVHKHADVARALTSTLGRPAAAAWWSVGSAPARWAKVASARSKRTPVRVGNSHSPSRPLLHSQISQTQVRPSSFLPCIDAGTAPPLTQEFTRTAASERCQQEPLAEARGQELSRERWSVGRRTAALPVAGLTATQRVIIGARRASEVDGTSVVCPAPSVRQDSMPGEETRGAADLS
eukprot:COSAG04_NODE_59_length_30260_cov_18.181327_11_plen_223_part_00